MIEEGGGGRRERGRIRSEGWQVGTDARRLPAPNKISQLHAAVKIMQVQLIPKTCSPNLTTALQLQSLIHQVILMLCGNFNNFRDVYVLIIELHSSTNVIWCHKASLTSKVKAWIGLSFCRSFMRPSAICSLSKRAHFQCRNDKISFFRS